MITRLPIRTQAISGQWLRVPYHGPNPARLAITLTPFRPSSYRQADKTWSLAAYYDRDRSGTYVQVRAPKDISQGEYSLVVTVNGESYDAGRILVQKAVA